MRESYDAIIVLSHHLKRDGTLSDETRERVEKGVSLLKKDSAKFIVMSGGYADEGVDISHASAMKEKAIKEGVRKEKIICEEESLDTTGQAIFCKNKIVIPNKWKKLIVVSHDYHIRRVKKIFSFVYGLNFEIIYEGIRSKKSEDAETLKSENELLGMFKKLFGGVKSGDDVAILKRMLDVHPLYKK